MLGPKRRWDLAGKEGRVGKRHLDTDAQSDLNRSRGRRLLACARFGKDEIHIRPNGPTAAVIRQMRHAQRRRLSPDEKVRQNGTISFDRSVLTEPLACPPGGVKVQLQALERLQVVINPLARVRGAAASSAYVTELTAN